MTSSATCPSCRRGIFSDDVFCSWCGARIQGGRTGSAGSGRTRAYETVRTSERTACHSCNGPVLPGDAFCSGCGAQVGATQVEAGGESWNRIAREIQKASRGKYEVISELGRGGMGLVFLATDTELHRRVAIKVLSPSLLTDDAMVQRFLREARIIASLRHESIVSVYDVGQAGDLRYFVMDFVDGVSLGHLLRTRGPLPIPLVEMIFYQIGQALAYVHRSARGLVHRDVKPSNVMLDPEGIAVLMDFGISKLDEAGGGITRTGLVMGTPEYMSPEQCRGLVATPESDQYALGAVAYAMLTGRPPFTGPFYQVLVAHQSEVIAPLRELREDCPPELASAVERMLAKLPGDRWPSISEALRAVGLRPLLPDDPLRGVVARLVAEGKGAPAQEGTPGTAGNNPPTGPTPTRLRIEPLPEIFHQGDVFALRATLLFESGDPASGVPLSWHSTDPGVARVNPDTGEMEAVGIGQATLFAVGAGLAESVAVQIRPPRVASVRIEPELATVEPGGRVQFRALLSSASGQPLDEWVVWEANDPDVLALTQDGLGIGVRGGTARVVARSGDVEGAALVRVQAVVAPPLAPPPPPPPAASPPPPPSAPARPNPVERPDPGMRVPQGSPEGVGPASRTGGPNRAYMAGGGVLVLLALAWAGWGILFSGAGDEVAVVPESDAAAVQPVGGGGDPTGALPGPGTPSGGGGVPEAEVPSRPGPTPPVQPDPSGPTTAGRQDEPVRSPPVAASPTAVVAPPPVAAAPPPPEPGQLRVRTRPFAQVFLNGVLRGEGFDVALEGLAPGRYRLRLEHPTLQAVDTFVMVGEGATTTVQRVLQPRNDP